MKQIKYFLLVIYFIVANVFYWQTDFVKGEPFLRKLPSECGVVEENFTDLVNIKHGTRTEYFLKVKYPNGSKVEKVSGIVYHTYYKIGTKICLTRSERIPVWYALIGFIDFVIIILAIVIYSLNKIGE